VSITKRGTRSYLVRVDPFAATTLRTKEDAERVELELKRRKALGEHYEAAPITLGEAMDGTLARLRATGNPSASWMALNELAARAWAPLRAHRVSALRRARIEDMTQERAAARRKSAKVELEFLKRVLREAKARGQHVDPAIFEIPAVRHKPRPGRALSVGQLHDDVVVLRAAQPLCAFEDVGALTAVAGTGAEVGEVVDRRDPGEGIDRIRGCRQGLSAPRRAGDTRPRLLADAHDRRRGTRRRPRLYRPPHPFRPAGGVGPLLRLLGP